VLLFRGMEGASKKDSRSTRESVVRETFTHTFDIECTNCHASKALIDAWRLKYKPVHFVCCDGSSEDLTFRSLPRGEDR
jgi:hypothetical protein